jgi:hypothetical protein
MGLSRGYVGKPSAKSFWENVLDIPTGGAEGILLALPTASKRIPALGGVARNLDFMNGSQPSLMNDQG